MSESDERTLPESEAFDDVEAGASSTPPPEELSKSVFHNATDDGDVLLRKALFPLDLSGPKAPLSGPEFLRAFDSHQARVHADRAMRGTIKLTINNLSSLKAKVTSNFHVIANLPWRLAAKTENTKRTNNTRFFSIYIDCNPDSESTLWSVDAVVEFRLRSFKSGSDVTRQFTNNFSQKSNNWGFPSFIEFSEISDPEKGFVENDRVVIEARITVHSVVGVSKRPSFSLTEPMPMSDAVLVIENTRLYVSKQYLALYSPVFESMFFGNFIEREKKEVTIEDVIPEEFTELLNVLYPSHSPINVDNVESLLELADKFQIQYVMDQCEEFLIQTNEVPVISKLVWADQYTLSNLQHACLITFKTVDDIRNIRATDEFRKLSDSTCAALLERMLKIV